MPLVLVSVSVLQVLERVLRLGRFLQSAFSQEKCRLKIWPKQEIEVPKIRTDSRLRRGHRRRWGRR